ncbi:hypothetical protein [Pyxidicoccus trucidator]|uniref:hypothetical protein n=1 Tax=Pyxidicoccus trucidator TaxID=2709662 RepID=UPI0013DBB6F9|nr:hypothetical protein [Pyxidicoccus trucidator]
MGLSARIVGLLSLSALLVGATGCCRAPFPFVAVREEVLRSDTVTLPLDPQGREHLLAFLRAGGDRDLMEEPPQLPEADQHYGPLLELLSSPENLDQEDINREDMGSGPYRQFFSSKPLRDVIDARQERPSPLNPPYALSDGRFWWLFERGPEGKLSRLTVFPAMRKPDEPQEVLR